MQQALASVNISTNTQVRTGPGVLTYAEAGAASMTLYDGTSSTGVRLTLLLAFAAREFTIPVGFNDGLFVSVASTTGFGLVHTG
jgi:hypothetical protein